MSDGPTLGHAFFDRSVHRVAVDLLGCTLMVDGVGGLIVETESYAPGDPACHAYRGQTTRNEPMFGEAAHAYVYLSYGIHTMLNMVCEGAGDASALLIRALEPSAGIERMRGRRRRDSVHELCSGPGKLAQALDVGLDLSGASLLESPFELLPRRGAAPEVVPGPRVGITRGTDLPWRYCIADSGFVSRPKPAAGTAAPVAT